jgi:hypothetical protein
MSSLTMDETIHEAAGYDLVWTSTDGSPFYPEAACSDSIFGPISTIFWLQGVEFLNELVDDPGYALQNEVTYLSHGSPKLWIVERLYGKTPR